MCTIGELRAQKNQWESLIASTEETRQEVLGLMRQAREELDSLLQLEKQYPNSVKIANRRSQCTSCLTKSTTSLEIAERLLSEFNQQKEVLQNLIEQKVKSNDLTESTALESESTGLTP